MPYLLYADDLVLCGESEERLRGLVERFGRVCKRMGLKQAYDRTNREALCQVLVIYDVGGKLLNGIKTMYDDSEACLRIN